MSRDDVTLVSLLIHVPAISAWVGLAGFDLFVAWTNIFNAEQKARIIASTRWLSLVLIAVIMVTGVWQTMENPFMRVHSYSALEHLRERTLYGKALFVKHIFVLLSFGVALYTRFYLARRPESVVAAAEGGAAIAGVAGASRVLGLATALNFALCLAALISAARMTIELH